MSRGPGKYDGELTLFRLATGARCAMSLVIGGFKGSGFSVQTDDPKIALALPGFLRTVADEIEKEFKAGSTPAFAEAMARQGESRPTEKGQT